MYFLFFVCGLGVQGGIGHIAYLLYSSPSALNGNFINNGYLWLLSRLKQLFNRQWNNLFTVLVL